MLQLGLAHFRCGVDNQFAIFRGHGERYQLVEYGFSLRLCTGCATRNMDPQQRRTEVLDFDSECACFGWKLDQIRRYTRLASEVWRCRLWSDPHWLLATIRTRCSSKVQQSVVLGYRSCHRDCGSFACKSSRRRIGTADWTDMGNR